MSNTTDTVFIERMFEAGAHFGLSRSRRHPTAKNFVFGAKNGIEIIDLEKTKAQLEEAKEVIRTLSRTGKKVLFVGTKNEGRGAVIDTASSIEMPYVVNRWLGGTLSNFSQIKKRIAHMEDLVEKRGSGMLDKYTKKERLLIDREIERLEKHFAGLAVMKELPAALFVIDAKKEHIAVAEARGMKIPVMSLSSSDCDFGKIEYPIPANDASASSIAFFLSEIAAAWKEGKTVTKS
ncbi:MAG: 30S ribosomal protein S2 [Candidatus Yonathbacteria bacterium RIFOXYC1_FULL_52_10]|uniref:Small ribosomal subunit protein uS2 n=1 Tax=Candidatus Yonathbacteria bacterium RIFOXYD1_FULL_52_36 TaxID=1802730 RepID=A0A1G2SKS8_9BACT|nr:MAG: 30S ribosomal protein S2 [Candidatus Yonathbacteria bacterium RIFOXYC1_FULL_52_10]OHA85308.1 MAG: 30S ribosomal protein S2 [Candidatus Yonathbacteria bacterium RIFOXYD1_FULL_52_36]